MILGIDPGLANTGWAVVDSGKLIDCGCIVTDKNDKRCDRLGNIFDSLQGIIKKFKIKEIAFENLFFAKNVKSAMKVAEAIGMIKILGYLEKRDVFEYTPLQVKSTLVGYGKAEKYQVEMMVRNELDLEENIKPSHAADAVAVALTHLFIKRDIV